MDDGAGGGDDGGGTCGGEDSGEDKGGCGREGWGGMISKNLYRSRTSSKGMGGKSDYERMVMAAVVHDTRMKHE